jgi:hypothetical protein
MHAGGVFKNATQNKKRTSLIMFCPANMCENTSRTIK